jgi:hypothetical protein
MRPSSGAGGRPLSLGRGYLAVVGTCLTFATLVAIAYATDRDRGAHGVGDAGGNATMLRDTIIPASEPGEQPIVVTRGARRYGSIWPTCTPAEVAVRVRDFTQALASGDAEAMREYWAPSPEWGRDFKWFTIHPDGPPFDRPWTVEIESRAQGIALVRERGGIRVRVRRLDLYIASVDGAGGALEGIYRPSQGTGARKKVIGAKFQFSCTGPELQVFSASVNKRYGITSCPKQDRRLPRNVRRKAMIACSHDDYPR